MPDIETMTMGDAILILKNSKAPREMRLKAIDIVIKKKWEKPEPLWRIGAKSLFDQMVFLRKELEKSELFPDEVIESGKTYCDFKVRCFNCPLEGNELCIRSNGTIRVSDKLSAKEFRAAYKTMINELFKEN